MEDGGPIDMSDDLQPIDQAMLLVLSHRQRDSTPLSLDQERLLDSWVAGHLQPIDADRAAALIKHNKFAAEHVLERRLVAAANEGPAIPRSLTTRILRGSQASKTTGGGIFNLRWAALSGWQWSGLGAAVAATTVMAVFGFQVWQTRLRTDQGFQIAMINIEDRSTLSEGARRTRGPQAPTPSTSSSEKPSESRYRDVEVPTALLRRAITNASTNKGGIEHSELMNYLRAQNDAFDNRAQILIDSALANSVSENVPERTSTQIRAYDLDDPRAVNIRTTIKTLKADTHAILLTLRR
jgi:hypothetical protein